MRKFKNLVIGGIESKIVNLILIAIILLTVGSAGISVTRDHLLTRLSQETNARQQQAITEVTEGVLDSVVRTNMQQVTGRDARLTDDMFKDLKTRVVMMGDYAQKLFEHPEDYPLHSFAEPDAALDGQLSAQVLYAPGVDKAALSERLGLLANLSELMLALCDAFGAENVFVAVPEGAVLIANNISASWVGEDGEPIPFNPLGSYWYDQAVEAGELVFSDIQTDTATGEICVTCVMPIYARGELQAVVGADLFLDVMESTAKKTSYDGGMLVVVNQNGHAVVSSFDEGLLAVRPSGEADDLRESENEVLAALTRDALEGSTDVRLLTLDGKEYYAMPSTVSTVGWTLITMYDNSKLDAPIETLQQNYDASASETAADYLEKNASYRNWGIAILLLFVVLLGGAAIMLGKRIVRPLNTMIERIAELDAEKPQFMMEDVYRTKDEIEALAESFAELSKQTVCKR